MPDQEAPKTPQSQKKLNYMKYSGMAFQMGLIILAGALAGRKLDAYMATSKPYMTLLFSLLAIAAALYVSLKDLLKS